MLPFFDDIGSVRFTLPANAASGHKANGCIGASDLHFDFNIKVTPEGKVNVEDKTKFSETRDFKKKGKFY